MLEKSPCGHVLCSCCCLALELSISRDISSIPTALCCTQSLQCGLPLQPWLQDCSLMMLTAAVQAPCLLRLGAAFIYTATASSKQAKNKKLAVSKQIASL